MHSVNADSHLGHVFPDSREEHGGPGYRITSAALRFIHRDDAEADGHGAYLDQVKGLQ
jgi:peptide-methionine (R)-S-oxide reductase